LPAAAAWLMSTRSPTKTASLGCGGATGSRQRLPPHLEVVFQQAS
jgi:hypothetical protein